jgi:purine catabolism regulator
VNRKYGEAMSVRGLAAVSELALDVIVDGGERMDVPIGAVFTSELPDPTQQMQGGELLLTTGRIRENKYSAWREYVSRLVEIGATGIGFGVGDDVTYLDVPEPLVRAAREFGFPLLRVPKTTAFFEVTKRFYHEREEFEKAKLQQAISLHQTLTAAAGTGNGLAAVARTWHAATGSELLVLDRYSSIIFRSRGFSDDALNAVSASVQSRALSAGASLRLESAGMGLRLLTVGGSQIKGYVALTVPPDTDVDASIPTLVALVTLDLERRWLQNEPDRRERSIRFQRFRGAESDAAARRFLRTLGVEASAVWGVVVEIPREGAEQIQEDLAVALKTSLIRKHDAFFEAFTFGEPGNALADLNLGCAVGIGSPATLGRGLQTLYQAHLALERSRRTGDVAAFVDGSSHQFLLQIADPEYLAIFANSVLGVVERAGNGAQLLETLETWLTSERSIGAAAIALGLHRHTVRDRLKRIEEILGKDLNTLDTQTELWLALKARGSTS